MPGITEYLLSKSQLIKTEKEYTSGFENYSMFNSGGVEVEVGEFLYGLVAMMKPKLLLETGTHLGISSSYIAQALKDYNPTGKMITCEVLPELREQAQALWKDLGLEQWIDSRLEPSLKLEPLPNDVFDILFLDSEPQYRFDEVLRFLPFLKPGGLILIHDLGPQLGHHGQTYNNEYDWPYGDFRLKLGPLMQRFELQTICFGTPRGLTIFQKASDALEGTKYLKRSSSITDPYQSIIRATLDETIKYLEAQFEEEGNPQE